MNRIWQILTWMATITFSIANLFFFNVIARPYTVLIQSMSNILKKYLWLPNTCLRLPWKIGRKQKNILMCWVDSSGQLLIILERPGLASHYCYHSRKNYQMD